MSYDLIIKNGNVILESEAIVTDVAVKDGKAVVLNGEITFHFKDGHTETRQYRERKRGTRHSEAYRAYMHEIMQYAKRKDPEAKKIMLALKEEWKREDNRWQKQ